MKDRANEVWFDDAGHKFASEDELYEFGTFDSVVDRRSVAARLRAAVWQIRGWLLFDVLKRDSIPF